MIFGSSFFLHRQAVRRACAPFLALGISSLLQAGKSSRARARSSCAPASECLRSGRGRSLRVLVDMDGVLADFEGGFLKKYRATYPDEPYIALEDRRGFWVSEQYGQLEPRLSVSRRVPDPKGLRSMIKRKRVTRKEKAIRIWESKDFFMELDPLPGAVEALKQMANLEETDVFICTSPIKKYRYCPYEKYAWIEKHLGHEFLEHLVLTRDKTVVSGDLLIDDRPDIIGAERNPTWEHVLFTACHNKHLQLPAPSLRLHSWADDWNALLDRKRGL